MFPAHSAKQECFWFSSNLHAEFKPKKCTMPVRLKKSACVESRLFGFAAGFSIESPRADAYVGPIVSKDLLLAHAEAYPGFGGSKLR